MGSKKNNYSDLKAEKSRKTNKTKWKTRKKNSLKQRKRRKKRIGEKKANTPSYDAMRNSRTLGEFYGEEE